MTTEYCEKYAKKEDITNTVTEEDISDDEDQSDGRSVSSEDETAGPVDP